MRLNMRQGVVSHQSGGFLQINTSLNVDLIAANRPVVVTVAHHTHDYLHSEDSTIVDAWIGPFNPVIEYWLYFDFNLLTFQRTFGFTTLEPVAQAIAPGADAFDIIQAVIGSNELGRFVVNGHFVLPPTRPLAVTGSTGNNGTYTVSSATYDINLNETTIFVNEPVLDATPDGVITLDIDIKGIPMLTDGRMWYDTNNNIHYELQGSTWVEVLRVFAAKLGLSGNFTSESIGSSASTFTGTQIGDESSILAGRVIFTENSNVIRRDDRSFLTTEDQFFTNQSRVDAIRLESNVARGQNAESALAAFSVVAWVDEGKIGTAQYNDINTAVVGMLTEDLLLNEVGGVIIQGVVTNPDWNWTTGIGAVSVGSPLWVDNGILVSVDPHVTDVLSFPQARVPVARVLDLDTIVFEQGLGGIGDQGPPGSLEDLPIATTSSLGVVTLVSPSSNPQQAFVITDTDSRLSDARIPLPHSHSAAEIIFVPTPSITSNNVQLALEELGTEKLDIAGDTMTGFLTLSANPTAGLHAATKQYVDGLVSGLVWLDPVVLINMISDNVAIPPTTPEISDAYIVPSGAVGAWSAIPAGNVVVWNELVWLDRGPVTAISTNIRFGIAMQTITTPSGSFLGKENQIALYDNTGTLTGFEIPTLNNAVYVSSTSSLHAFNQFAFSGSGWILFGGASPISVDDVTIALSTNVLSVKQFGDGGINDVSHWQGLIPSDLDVIYSPIVHLHSLESLTDTDLTTVPPIDGDALVYNNSTSVWEPGVIASGGGGAPYTFVAETSILECTQLDDTFWSSTNGAIWNGTTWTIGASETTIDLSPIGTWTTGFTPTTLRITIEDFGGASPPIDNSTFIFITVTLNFPTQGSASTVAFIENYDGTSNIGEIVLPLPFFTEFFDMSQSVLEAGTINFIQVGHNLTSWDLRISCIEFDYSENPWIRLGSFG